MNDMMKQNETCAMSVVIVSYRNYKVLQDCLKSIVKFNDLQDGLEVIVVEQSPEGDLYSRLRSDFPWVRAIRNENRGFGAGNNVGVRAASGKYLLLLNPDTILVEPVFRFAVDQFEHNANLGLFGVRLLNENGERNQSFYFRKPYGILRGSLLYRFCDARDKFMPHAMYITGADMFVRSDAFVKVGGFDERMFLYFEETYLCTRLNEAGYRIGYCPQRQIVHLEGQSTISVDVFRRRLDSLEVLCGDFGWDFPSMLRGMRRDREIKKLFGSRPDERAREISEIDKRLGSK